MRRPALLLFVAMGCSFDASGFGEPPATSNSTPGSSTGSTATIGGESSGGGGPTTGETSGGPGGGSLSGSTGGGVTTEPGTATTGGTTETSATTTTTTTEPGTTTEPCEQVDAWVDADGDTFGDPNMAVKVCAGESNGVADNAEDCNDAEPNAHPGLTESCDEVDNDCDGLVNEYDPDTNKMECKGCYYRFHKSRLYYFCKQPELKWDDARAFCVARGLDLTIGNDQPEHDFHRGEIDALSSWPDRWWIGGRKSGTFKWVDGSALPVPDGRWGASEPNNQSEPFVYGADCVGIFSPDDVLGGGKWVDWKCGDGQFFVCEQKD
jgi:hypothetical protein